MITTPPVRRRLVGQALRRYRENLGLTLEDAARTLSCDRSKISRIETGQRGIRGKELRLLLAEYGIGEKQQATLAGIADPHGAHAWCAKYADVLPDAGRDYLLPDDVKAVAEVVLGHRVAVTSSAELGGSTSSTLIGELLANTPVPVRAPVAAG